MISLIFHGLAFSVDAAPYKVADVMSWEGGGRRVLVTGGLCGGTGDAAAVRRGVLKMRSSDTGMGTGEGLEGGAAL